MILNLTLIHKNQCLKVSLLFKFKIKIIHLSTTIDFLNMNLENPSYPVIPKLCSLAGFELAGG